MQFQPQPKPSHSSNSEIAQEGSPPQGGYKDVFWAILFVLNVVAVCVAAAMNVNKINVTSSDSKGAPPDVKPIVASLAVGLLASVAFGIFWIRYLSRPSNAANIIKFALYANAALMIAGVLLAFITGQIVTGIIMLILCGITLVWYYVVRNRKLVCYLLAGVMINTCMLGIAFTGVMLEMAASCTREYGSTVYIAIGTQVVSMAWVAVWVIAVLGANGAQNAVVQFLLALSLYWTVNVLLNVVQVVVGGVAASWFYRSQLTGVVSSCKRACTTSFGSICFGSFIVSVIEVFRAVARSAARENGNEIVACIVDCILGIIQAIAEFITKYAYAYVAIWVNFR